MSKSSALRPRTNHANCHPWDKNAAHSSPKREVGRPLCAAMLSPDRMAANIGESKWCLDWRPQHGGAVWPMSDGNATTG